MPFKGWRVSRVSENAIAMCCGDSVIAVTCVTLNTAAAGTSIVSSPFFTATVMGAPLQLTCNELPLS